jgi:hypothetical protein
MEQIAAVLYSKSLQVKLNPAEYHDFPLRENSDEYRLLLNEILQFRAKKQNAEFEWTDAKREKFIAVSSALTETFRAAYEEAVSEAKNLEKRIANGDKFITDYEIEARVEPYITSSDSSDFTFANVLCESTGGVPITHSISHAHFWQAISETPIYLDTALNWNIEVLASMFTNEYIGYCIHALLESCCWSFADILNIETLRSEVLVIRQNSKSTTIVPKEKGPQND